MGKQLFILHSLHSRGEGVEVLFEFVVRVLYIGDLRFESLHA